MNAHEVQFHQNRYSPDVCRATCTCGWFHFGPLKECQTRAATHDIDEWQAIEPAPQPAAVQP